MSAVATKSVSFEIRDVTGQKSATVDVPADLTIGELIPKLLADLSLPQNDSSEPSSHCIRRDSDGVVLSESDAVEELKDEKAVLVPSVTAGAQ